MLALRNRFPLLYDAIVRIEGFKSWRPADPARPRLPWWHAFKRSSRVHAFGLPPGSRVDGIRLPKGGVLLVSPLVGLWFTSRNR